MKINEVEAAVGVTKKNIRFYEERGSLPQAASRATATAATRRRTWNACAASSCCASWMCAGEIREMLEGQKTLAEGMGQQLER